MSHFSFSASTNITDIFKTMFPDSAIAQKMKFESNKLSYLICFGIAPFFKQQLLVGLKETQCFVISLDVSLNYEFHEEQIVNYLNKE